jgi:hypothetical protein
MISGQFSPVDILKLISKACPKLVKLKKFGSRIEPVVTSLHKKTARTENIKNTRSSKAKTFRRAGRENVIV